MSHEYGVPLTTDPDDDKYPHYYPGDGINGGLRAGVVYADELPGLDKPTIGAGPWNSKVHVDVEAYGGDTKMSMGIELDPDTARNLARSLLLSADLAEGGDQ